MIRAIRYRVVLPSKIGNLWQLEYFHIAAQINSSKGEKFQKLPSDFVNLSQLLHLKVFPKSLLVDGIGNMKSLRTLSRFDLGNSLDSIKGLRELTNLTDLQISCDDNNYTRSRDEIAVRCRELLHALENLCNLKILSLFGKLDHVRGCLDAWCLAPAPFSGLKIFYATFVSWFSRVPNWIGQLQGVYDLSLTVQEVLEKDIGMLAQLTSLIYLTLDLKGVPRDKILIRGGNGFHVLKHFRVYCCRISYLTFEAGAMPRLEWLQLFFNAQGWDKHGAVSAGIEHLSCLKDIFVNIGGAAAKESNKSAAQSAFRDAASMHPGLPAANINIANTVWSFDCMDDDELDEEDTVGTAST